MGNSNMTQKIFFVLCIFSAYSRMRASSLVSILRQKLEARQLNNIISTKSRPHGLSLHKDFSKEFYNYTVTSDSYYPRSSKHAL